MAPPPLPHLPHTGPHVDLWRQTRRCPGQASFCFRVYKKTASHLGQAGIEAGKVSVIAEECNRQADSLAAQAVLNHTMLADIVEVTTM